MELLPQSDNFKLIVKRFKKAWPKGNAPKVDFVYKIINPQVAKHFEEYQHGLPIYHRKPSFCYHGTRLHCNMAEFPELCQNPACGVCHVSRGWAHSLPSEERGGGGGVVGLCFSADPSRSHCFASSQGPHRALLVCKVVVGRGSKMEAAGGSGGGGGEGGSVDSAPPSPDMGRQMGDIVVRNIDAVCPLYIILYTYP